MPPCGGAPNWKASSRKPNFSWASSWRQAHDLEDPLLHVAAVDTDRPAADLVAVADHVVGVRERRAGVGVEGVEELGLRRGERVVHGRPRPAPTATSPAATASEAGSNSGASSDPQEAPRVLVDEAAAPADLEPGGAEQRPGRAGRARGEEDAVARLAPRRARPGRRARPRTGSWPPGRRASRPPGRGRRPARGRRAAWPSPARRRAACGAGSRRRASRRHRRTRPGRRGRGCRRRSRCTRRAPGRSAGRACRCRSGASPRRRSSARTGVAGRPR